MSSGYQNYKMNITKLVKGNKVIFDSFRQGIFYYKLIVEVEGSWDPDGEYKIYQFTIPLEDIGTATLLAEDKAITFMRWIRKATETDTLTEIK